MNEQKYYKQFEIMREIAVSSSSGLKPSEIANLALEKAADLVGLTAATLVLWDENQDPILTVTHSKGEQESELLAELEESLFSNLRKKRHLVSAYVSFGGDKPVSCFTLPVKKRDEILGAVIGIQPGTGSLVREDSFLEALSAALSIAILVARLDSIIEKEKLEAVMATATAINHEINNPLQAIVGSVQLLPKDRKGYDEELVKKLTVIEESALAITKVTHKLMQITEIELIDYINGTKMLKLPEDENTQ